MKGGKPEKSAEEPREPETSLKGKASISLKSGGGEGGGRAETDDLSSKCQGK